METSFIIQIIVNGLLAGLLYVLITLGLTLIFGILDIVNFAHGEFYMLGAFSIYFLFDLFNLPYILAFLITFIIIGAFGCFIEYLIFRPVRHIPINSLVVSLGLSIFLGSLALHLFGPLDKNVESIVKGTFSAYGAIISYERILIMATSLAMLLFTFVLIKATKLGKAMRAVAQNKEAAAYQGINIDMISYIGFGIGCALAASAGAIIAPVLFISPSMGLPVAIKAFIALVLGGMGSITGAVVGGLLLGFLESITQSFTSSVWADIISFLFLIVFLIFKPTGLFGHDEK